MSHWLIQPRDGLAFRDGRPNERGSQSRTLGFPLPHTIAGALRARLGSDAAGRFTGNPWELLKESMRGPLLVREGRRHPGLLLPAPKDALWHSEGESVRLLALKPLEQDGPAKGLHSNPEELLAVGLPKAEAVDGKPPKDQPVFWHWEDLRSWLESPGQAGPGTVMARGEKALVQDRRVSVAIRSDSGTYVDGALFEVASLAFRSGSPKQLEDAQEFSLLMATDTTKPLPEGIGFLGGKNRLVAWAKAPSGLWPECPEAVLKSVAATGRCRILLATPGVFTAGWQPEWLLQAREGVTPVLKAALVTRPETFSGWDYAANQGKGQPKATRRAVASGCVYWLELAGSGSQREAWVKSVWLESVSDVEQDRLDGFGLALVGVWA